MDFQNDRPHPRRFGLADQFKIVDQSPQHVRAGVAMEVDHALKKIIVAKIILGKIIVGKIIRRLSARGPRNGEERRE
jgi:hypothetical protein